MVFRSNWRANDLKSFPLTPSPRSSCLLPSVCICDIWLCFVHIMLRVSVFCLLILLAAVVCVVDLLFFFFCWSSIGVCVCGAQLYEFPNFFRVDLSTVLDWPFPSHYFFLQPTQNSCTVYRPSVELKWPKESLMVNRVWSSRRQKTVSTRRRPSFYICSERQKSRPRVPKSCGSYFQCEIPAPPCCFGVSLVKFDAVVQQITVKYIVQSFIDTYSTWNRPAEKGEGGREKQKCIWRKRKPNKDVGRKTGWNGAGI